ncbi:MAG: cysteine--tRNA ligase [Geobacteraceae bacterium]
MAALRIYNTLSGGKDEFVPLTPGKVGMYVCGVTVYDHCHIGHARANVVFDVIYRYLMACGYEVTYVRNYTDIDDKIINRANREGISCQDISERFIAEFDHDMAQLRIAIPTCRPKATEHIGEIVRLIENLIRKGCAYQSEGDVYFSVERFDPYLKLSKRNLDEMQAGARIEVGQRKRHPMDFALWKASKPGEPFWESPWGMGRPGWHVECSAMSMKYLGESFDIHGGGKDLIFPHHENEIAQSEASTGKPFVKYWLHNGFVNINAEKMSKSLGNFFTIKEVLEKYDSEVLRFFLLSAHYRSPLDFSDQSMTEAEAGLERIYKSLAGIDELMAEASPTEAPAETSETLQELAEKTGSFRQRFREAMDDDFNTALALGNVFDLVRSANRLLADKSANSAACALLGEVKAIFAEIGGILGIFTSEPSAYLSRIRGRKAEGLQIMVEEIERLIEERAAARKAREFKRSDDIRNFLLDRNVMLFDGPQGTTWKVK